MDSEVELGGQRRAVRDRPYGCAFISETTKKPRTHERHEKSKQQIFVCFATFVVNGFVKLKEGKIRKGIVCQSPFHG